MMAGYQNVATADTPALVIFLLDCSGSMRLPCAQSTRLQVVQNALENVVANMISRSIRGDVVRPRYRIAILAYSHVVVDILDGFKSIDILERQEMPQLPLIGDLTRTREAFTAAEDLLAAEVPNLSRHDPAPQLFHLTDGEFTPGSDPTPIAQRIMRMETPDGKVLVENVYITDEGLSIPDIQAWRGIRSETEVPDGYARTLFHVSSPIPNSYRAVLTDWGYVLAAGARMLFPGNQPELIQLGFAISGATPTSRSS